MGGTSSLPRSDTGACCFMGSKGQLALHSFISSFCNPWSCLVLPCRDDGIRLFQRRTNSGYQDPSAEFSPWGFSSVDCALSAEYYQRHCVSVGAWADPLRPVAAKVPYWARSANMPRTVVRQYRILPGTSSTTWKSTSSQLITLS